MKKSLSAFLIIMTSVSFSAQNIIKYDFKKRVNHVFQDVLYVAFEDIMNNSYGKTKNIELGIIPLSFALWNNKNVDNTHSKKQELHNKYEIYRYKSDDHFNVRIDLNDNKEGVYNNSMSIDTNKLLIKFEKDKYNTHVYTYLDAFGISFNFDNDENNTGLSKNFFCKTKVNSNGYINTAADFRIYNIFYFTTLSISSRSWDKKNDNERFDITIYEVSDNDNTLRMRKTLIKGNNEGAIKYLKKNDIDYVDYLENWGEKFKEEDFKPLE
ncbi:hypothetical protein [Chryseobacterium luteum]|uniref:Uncharacterized protein n=1 Tax=Chryseobacterium luteum TaxID=421531 RepID=A0A085ZX61_9FLAO|nr:hypothetical protein [Chryseobacterium luteum]KFF09025.1 hypothetical protein IX38_00465 [Chryseobacterium luteum]